MSAVARHPSPAPSFSLALLERAPARLLMAFAALGAFGAGHWARLVQGPPLGGLAVAVTAAVALGAGLIAIGGLDLPRGATHAAAALATLAGVALALVAVGLPAGLLQPARWDDLADEVDRGLSGIRTVSWPYGGSEEPVRLALLAGAPLLLSLAAALAFWPLRRGAAVGRAAALVLLLVLYCLPAIEHDPGQPLLRGAALFALLSAWLWLPRLGRREAMPAAALLAAVAVLSLPLAARLDSDTPLIDYKAWNPFGGRDVTFNWNHTYGPLAWPRQGTTLLNVRARRPNYWKAETLDRFDGLRWVRSKDNERTAPFSELPRRPDRRWEERIRVTVRALRTDFVVTAGTPYLVTGAGGSLTGSGDGTVRRLDEPLQRGDVYTVRTYAPNPAAWEMRAAERPYATALSQYTRLTMPAPGVDALRRGRPDAGRGEVVRMPLRGAAPRAGAAARRSLAASRYGRAFRLAQRLGAGAPTAYDAVKRIERHLRRNYTYSERPPSRPYPLESFLFEDRVGYCQQFSGAMALMLRMVGIPARAVSGFSPGSFNRDSGEYRVRDLDAHSWVEVYFTGIGWVTFDPTPASAPADRAGAESDPARDSRRAAGSISSSDGGASPGDRPQRPSPRAPGADGGGISLGLTLTLALLLAALACAAAATLRRRRQVTGAAATDASLRELRRALGLLGWDLTPATTLLQLERRLGRVAGPRAAGYVSRLRCGRFAGARVTAPGAADRRALRRELTAGRGLRLRLRGYRALPPGGRFSGS